MHDDFVETIILAHFDTKPLKIERKNIGICNEVYEACLSDKSVIVRIGVTNSYLQGTSVNIPLFHSLGLKVPQILAEDFSKKLIPHPYQVLSRLPGKDLGQVIEGLTESELDGVAKEVATILTSLKSLPTDGTFGCVRIPASTMFASWTDCIRARIAAAIKRNTNPEVLSNELIELVLELFEKKEPYLSQVKSTFFYDDMGSKNVLVDNGVFSGLVDLDFISYGDPLDGLGSIKASWPDSGKGSAYLEKLMAHLELGIFDRQMVNTYAVFHRFFWLSEMGRKYNANTNTDINWDEVKRSQAIIKDLAEQAS
jgi:aminoglycoside phosphotransferase (APT) family kinase protein